MLSLDFRMFKLYTSHSSELWSFNDLLLWRAADRRCDKTWGIEKTFLSTQNDFPRKTAYNNWTSWLTQGGF